MNKPDTQLKDLIHVERGIIPANLCDYLVDAIEKNEWRPHTWYNAVQGTFGSEETKELDVQNITAEHQQLLTPFMIQAGASYNAKYHFECERTMQIMNKFSAIRFNRYSPGQIMRQHMDHIHSLWNTQDAGIPVLSFILNLNDDYEGAELYFWEDYKVPLGKGDIIMFPSLFLFPHGVTEATRGRRYSAVSWSW
jgi:predicted 2-oxoglutarate/Fe(II)-dependent dioxygenase YbiX